MTLTVYQGQQAIACQVTFSDPAYGSADLSAATVAATLLRVDGGDAVSPAGDVVKADVTVNGSPAVRARYHRDTADLEPGLYRLAIRIQVPESGAGAGDAIDTCEVLTVRVLGVA